LILKVTIRIAQVYLYPICPINAWEY
jgi:hypothetical protein